MGATGDREVVEQRLCFAGAKAGYADLPLDFRLDDSMALRPDLKLSSAAELRIEARVSKSGDAIPRPGDLAGESATVRPGARNLKLSIDRIVPDAR